ncbi:unnamed protein product, partial [Discosporangium mesarthrocarpum]
MSKRVAVYARVSTTRQAEADISIPDQLRHAREHCEQRGWQVVAEFVDPGASARDDKRPEFRRMIDAACIDPSPFDCVLVHSFSRFFRDSAGAAIYGSKLADFGVTVLSMTQEVGEGPNGKLMRSIISAFDTYQSDETAKHVTRTMKANAEQGFWNGGRAPFGYRTKVVEKRGKSEKKVLEIEPREAEIVRLMFRLYLGQHPDAKGPIGLHEMSKWLAARRLYARGGKPFYKGQVHEILRKETYAGTHYYNRTDSRTKQKRPREEWIAQEVPCLIDRETFDQVQSMLTARRPKVTPPRIVRSQVLLSGLARCEGCGGKLILRTGNGNGGNYRYYACARKVLAGGDRCETPVSIRMDMLDETVCEELAERILTPDHMRGVIRETLARMRHQKRDSGSSTVRLEQELRKVDREIENLVDMIASGEITNLAALKSGLSKREERKAELLRLISTERRRANLVPQTLSNAQIDRYGDSVRQAVLSGPVEFRKAYLKLLVSEVRVDRETIRISGSKVALAAAAIDQAKQEPGKVLASGREWW